MIYEAKYDELIDLLCGEQIGEGMSRAVFECRLNPKWVVKIEGDKNNNFQNVMEYKVWQDTESYKEGAKWLAPCIRISSLGSILIQERTEPVRYSDVPEKIPHFLTDQKLSNYGMLNGKFVCHDYGSFILTNGISKKMKKSEFSKDF